MSRDFARLKPAIKRWLETTLLVSNPIESIEISIPTSAGVANETWIVLARSQQGDETRFVFRLQGDEHLYPNPDISLQARVTREVVQSSQVPVPHILAFEQDTTILGMSFLVMEWIAGQVPPDIPNLHQSGWMTELPASSCERIWRDCVERMAQLHAMDASNFRFLLNGEASEEARPESTSSGLRSALRYWDNYSAWSAARQLAIFAQASEWLSSNLPGNCPNAFSWGDARLANVIIRDDRCAALLDWDLASLAGPEADLAWWALADNKRTVAQGVSRLTGIGSPAQTISLWESLSGRRAHNMEWYLVFAAYRQALISFRLFDLAGSASPSPSEFLNSPGIGVQWLASLLNLELPVPLTMPFVGLET